MVCYHITGTLQTMMTRVWMVLYFPTVGLQVGPHTPSTDLPVIIILSFHVLTHGFGTLAQKVLMRLLVIGLRILTGSVCQYSSFHASKCHAKGTLVVQEWPSVPFWPIIFPTAGTPALFVTDSIVLDKADLLLHPDRAGANLFYSEPNSNFTAL